VRGKKFNQRQYVKSDTSLIIKDDRISMHCTWKMGGLRGIATEVIRIYCALEQLDLLLGLSFSLSLAGGVAVRLHHLRV
jgi:hypothetical protein